MEGLDVKHEKYPQEFLSLLVEHQHAELFYFEWEEAAQNDMAAVCIGQNQQQRILALAEREINALVRWVNSWRSAITLFVDEHIFYARHLCLAEGQHRLHLYNATQRVQEYHQLHRLAIIDQLTGLGNRRCAEQNIRRLLSATASQSYWIALFDMDNLKGINDEFGHLVGDVCLRTMAKAVQKHESSDMIACRIGGDEFLLFLPKDCDIKSVLQQISRELRENSPLPFSITTTYSHVLLHSDLKEQDDVLSLLDKRLYRSKKKKRVVTPEKNKGPWASISKRMKREIHDGRFAR